MALRLTGRDSPQVRATGPGPPAGASGGLDLVVAATGPAPFTGLRAGLVTARTIGRVLGVPVHGVPSLDAVARAAFDELDALNDAAGDHRPAGAGGSAVTGPDAQTVRVVTDARRKEVYTAAYRRRGADDVERVSELEVLAPAALDRAEGPRPAEVLAGSGALLYPPGQRGSWWASVTRKPRAR